MKIFLLIAGIVLIVACVSSALFAALNLFGFYHTHDGSSELYARMRIRATVFFIVAAVLAVAAVACFIVRANIIKNEFPFSDPPETACLTCTHVLDKSAPVKYVSHDEDGCWQFLCGEVHDTSEARMVALSEIIKIDKKTADFAKLSRGEYAEYQDDTGNWTIQKR